MTKPVFNFREAYERVDAIKGRLNEMAENLDSDKSREAFTEAEEGERKQLFRELDILEMKIKAATPTIELMNRENIAEVNRRRSALRAEDQPRRSFYVQGQHFRLCRPRHYNQSRGYHHARHRGAAVCQDHPLGYRHAPADRSEG